METITKSAKETFNLGKEIGSSLTGGEILAFIGNLGAGKTTFIQGLAEGIGIKNKIVSPTFILMRQYESNSSKPNFFHLDLYRLDGDIKKEVENLGLFDIWKSDNNVVAIEWAEKMEHFLPPRTKYIRIENLDENKRKISIT